MPEQWTLLGGCKTGHNAGRVPRGGRQVAGGYRNPGCITVSTWHFRLGCYWRRSWGAWHVQQSAGSDPELLWPYFWCGSHLIDRQLCPLNTYCTHTPPFRASFQLLKLAGMPAYTILSLVQFVHSFLALPHVDDVFASQKITECFRVFFSGFANLTLLSFQNSTLITAAGMQSFAHLVNLKHLDLECCPHIHGGLVHIKGNDSHPVESPPLYHGRKEGSCYKLRNLRILNSFRSWLRDWLSSSLQNCTIK